MSDEGLAGYRVLVVEDDYFVAEELVAALNRTGAKVLGPVSTADGGKALALEMAPDCVLLDVNLRGEHAFALANELAERGIFTVITTGYDREFIAPHIHDITYLQKPLDLRALLECLRKHAARRVHS